MKYNSYAVSTANLEENQKVCEYAQKQFGRSITASEKPRWYKFTRTSVHYSDASVYRIGSIFDGILAVESIMSFNEWQDYLNPKPRKVVGYKLLKDVPRAEAGTVLELGANDIYFIRKKGIAFADVFPARFLESTPEWFEPIYEEEEKVFTIRNSSEPFTMTVSKGHIRTEYRDGATTYDSNVTLLDLNNLVQKAKSLGTWNGHNISASVISIGCRARISVTDLEAVLREYHLRNPS
jgi:hypothetical protein